MESKYHYFKRDISWLSFNHRVLLEADDDSLPLYERINFVSIYSSNLEEFYKIRVAEHKAIASGGHSDDITQEEAKHLIHQITEVVNEQMEDRIRIYERKLIPALREPAACGVLPKQAGGGARAYGVHQELLQRGDFSLFAARACM